MEEPKTNQIKTRQSSGRDERKKGMKREREKKKKTNKKPFRDKQIVAGKSNGKSVRQAAASAVYHQHRQLDGLN